MLKRTKGENLRAVESSARSPYPACYVTLDRQDSCPMEADRALELLLLSLFSSVELRRFLRYLPDGRSLLELLPGGSTAPAVLAQECVALLVRDGRVGEPEFWESLTKERTRRAPEIASVRSRFSETSALGASLEASTLKVLFVSASPDGVDRLRVDREYRDLTVRLRATGHGGRIQLIPIPAARLHDLRTGLVEHEPDVLHISCHGTLEGALRLDVDDDEFTEQAVDGERIVELVRALGSNLKLIVLNACNSARLARRLAGLGGQSIAIDGSIEDSEAIAFVLAFYELLAHGRSIETSFQAALVGLRGDGGAPRMFPDRSLYSDSR